MKIKSILFRDHPILNSLEVNFMSDSFIPDISLIVGQNGCGKTIFLNELHKIFSAGITPWNDGVHREITLAFEDDEIQKYSLPSNTLRFVYSEQGVTGWNRISVFSKSGKNYTHLVRQKLIRPPNINLAMRCAFSPAEINFTSKNIETVKATTIDDEEIPKKKSDENLATEIAQLLVDIKFQDDAERAEWVENNQGKNLEVPKFTGKLERFSKSYSKMFSGKELSRIRADEGRHKILFKDTLRNVEFEISQLSSGEKQVVYRAGYILRNLKALNRGIIFIDEPEMSLHPKWQAKYIDFVREIFIGDDLDIQIIIATHSPLLLKIGLDSDVSVIAFTKDENGKIVSNNVRTAGFGALKWSPTWGEICHFAFEMDTIEFHEDLYANLQEVNQTDTIKSTEEWLT